MPKLTMTKGLPASGKTTWAKKQNAKRVNKDDLRAMIDDGKWSKANEKEILEVRDDLIYGFLSRGHDVIVDDTNLHPKHELRLRQIAEDWAETGTKVDFEIKDFTDVKLKTCIERDMKRENPVGKKVIMDMYNRFVKQPPEEYTPDPDKPYCIICDIDGTLAHMTGRSPYDDSLVHTDKVDQTVLNILLDHWNMYDEAGIRKNYILIVSGRKDSCKDVTVKWLEDNHVPYDEIHMRKADDNREDSIVKKEIYDTWIKRRYNVRFVLDDRDRVVEMWRELGLKCLQVEPGDF